MDYDMLLHFTIAHLRSVDGALPPFGLTFSKEKERTGTYFADLQYGAYFTYCPFCIYRHIISQSQPVYGFWYYFMIHRGIGTEQQRI
jgi:hypothetical protein